MESYAMTFMLDVSKVLHIYLFEIQADPLETSKDFARDSFIAGTLHTSG